MRIGIDARLWDETGVGRYIRNLVWQIQEQDMKNEYVLFVKRQSANSNQQIVQEKFKVQNAKFKVVEVDIHWHSLKEQTSFARVLNKENLDLMHFPYFSLPILYRKPFVVTIHDLIFHHFSTGKASTLPLPLYMMKRRGYKVVFKHALTKSKAIIVPLQSVKAELVNGLRVPEEKVFVTKEGFDPRILKITGVSDDVKNEVQKGKYFMYVGNAYPHKNVAYLIQEIITFRREHPEYRLLLVIKKDQFLRELAKKYHDEFLSYISDVSDHDLGYLYKHAEAFVSASLMEGFGLPPLEAIVSSCPVIVSDIPSFKEVCGKHAFYFNPQEKGSLVSVLSSFCTLTDKEKAILVKRAIRSSVDFSWERMARETIKVYEGVL